VEVRPVIGFDYENSFYAFNWITKLEDNYNRHLGIDGTVGIETAFKNGNLSLFFDYEYEGTTRERELFFHTFRLYSHFLGGGIKYTYRNEMKRFRPFIALTGLTENKTNKLHHFIDSYFDFIGYPEHTYTTALGSQGNPPYVYDYYSNFYESTPFVGSALLGCDFRIVQHLHATVGIGYGIRVMKTKYATWEEWDDEIGTTDVEALLKTAPVTTHIFHLLDVQVGIYYGIGFGKKGKAKGKL